MFKKIQKNHYTITEWSGGKTTELFIWPQESNFKDLDFDVRVSLATVELEESVFTPLPGVYRYLTVLKGNHKLAINDQNYKQINPMEPIFFRGDDDVRSLGKSINFNVMSRQEHFCAVEYVTFRKNEEVTFNPESKRSFCYAVKGQILLEECTIGAEESFFTDTSMQCTAGDEAVLIQITF